MVMDVVDIMAKCKGCVDKQNWLLESGDGSQVVCLCYDHSDTQMDMGNQDAATQTPTNRIATTVPDAPKRKAQKPNWMNSGRDIRRHLFSEYNWQKMEEVKDNRWAILKVQTIATSSTHRCVRRFYIGDKDGDNYLEMEFYPCITYKNLSEEYKKLFHSESYQDHRLCYNPRHKSPPCSVAISKLNDFIVYNEIETILFNEEPDSYNEKVELKICEELGIQCRNIRWTYSQYIPLPTSNLKKKKDIDDNYFVMAPPFQDHSDDEGQEEYERSTKRRKTV